MKATAPRRLAGAWLAVAAVLFTPNARAHALELSTARISLRDGHIEVVVEVDSVQLVQQASGTPQPTALATASDENLASWTAAARAALADGAHLQVDGAAVALEIRAFPSPSEVRFLAATLAGTPNVHPQMSTLRLETTQPLTHPTAVALALPANFGRVLYTFIQPTMNLADPGAPAAFSILTPQTKPQLPTAIAAAPNRASWFAFAAGLLAAIAALVQFLPRRAAAVQAHAQDVSI